MKIDEAIGRLEQHTCYLESINAQEQVEAHKLGIEALKQVRQIRVYAKKLYLPLLPGETDE